MSRLREQLDEARAEIRRLHGVATGVKAQLRVCETDRQRLAAQLARANAADEINGRALAELDAAKAAILAELAQAQADAAAMREALIDTLVAWHAEANEGDGIDEDHVDVHRRGHEALALDPGRAFLERLQRAEAERDALKADALAYLSRRLKRSHSEGEMRALDSEGAWRRCGGSSTTIRFFHVDFDERTCNRLTSGAYCFSSGGIRPPTAPGTARRR